MKMHSVKHGPEEMWKILALNMSLKVLFLIRVFEFKNDFRRIFREVSNKHNYPI